VQVTRWTRTARQACDGVIGRCKQPARQATPGPTARGVDAGCACAQARGRYLGAVAGEANHLDVSSQLALTQVQVVVALGQQYDVARSRQAQGRGHTAGASDIVGRPFHVGRGHPAPLVGLVRGGGVAVLDALCRSGRDVLHDERHLAMPDAAGIVRLSDRMVGQADPPAARVVDRARTCPPTAAAARMPSRPVGGW
jgi:hypothetical protein